MLAAVVQGIGPNAIPMGEFDDDEVTSSETAASRICETDSDDEQNWKAMVRQYICLDVTWALILLDWCATCMLGSPAP